jgi:hypothetical protein
MASPMTSTILKKILNNSSASYTAMEEKNQQICLRNLFVPTLTNSKDEAKRKCSIRKGLKI